MKVPFPATPLMALDAVAIDLETTGLEGVSARIVEIGAVGIDCGRPDPKHVYAQLVNPGIPVPESAAGFHGVTTQKVLGAPLLESVLENLEAFIGKRVLIAHNMAYDLAVLRSEYERIGRRLPNLITLDVRVLARLVTPTLAHDGLPQLCEWLGIGCTALRSATGDAMAAANVYAALVPHLKERGIRTIAEAIKACAERDGDVLSLRISDGDPGQAVDGLHGTIPQIDSYPYRHRIDELMSSPPLVVAADESIRSAMQTMLLAGTSSTFVRDTAGGMGIVTERDILRAVGDRGGAALDVPVGQISSRPLVTVDRNEFLYRALARITRLGIRHLAVTDDGGEVVGALTPRSLLRQRASAALVLGEDIDGASNGVELGAAFGRLAKVAEALIAEDVEPRRIANVISAEIAAATRRAGELAEQTMAADGWGSAPVPYALFVMGSVGRGESLLAADQDNAIVYQSGEPGGREDLWFEELGTRVAQTLDDAGIPFCKGGVMAKNAPWRHSVAGWKGVIDGWVRKQTPQDLLYVDIFFDGLAVHGDRRLAEEIRIYALQTGRQSRDFQTLLTELARQWHAPLNLLGQIKLDETGRIDLKKGGLLPILTAARVIAIRNGSPERSTPERLKLLERSGKASSKDIERVLGAHQLLLGTILYQQIRDTAAGAALSTRVALEGMRSDEKAALKKAINDVQIAIDLVSEGRF
ncbi:MAG: DUF294 nucleotidyltransferase-like domain-containing protein [Hyphomicrobiaceae bacterium]